MGKLTKRLLLVIACLSIALLLPACTAVEAVSVSPRYGESLEKGQGIFETAVMLGNDEDFSYTLLYPQFQIAALDNWLLAWAEQEIDTVYRGHPGNGAASLYTHYSAVEISDALYRLDFTGHFTADKAGAEDRWQKSLYVDLEDARFKVLGELMDLKRFEDFLQVVRRELPETELGQITCPEALQERLKLDNGYCIIELQQSDNDTTVPAEQKIEFSKLGNLLFFGPYIDLDPVLTEEPEEPEDNPVEDLVWRPREIDPEKPMIALTFDDGPSEMTEKILDLLEEHRVKATFFMVGNQIDGYPDTLLRMVELQSEPANHTWDHKMKLPRRNGQGIQQQIQETIDKIEEVTGHRSELVRPPYGEVDKNVKAIAKDLGVYLVNWSIDPMDWKSRDAELIYDGVMDKVKDGSIVLLHDLYQSTVDAAERLIPDLLDQGYQLVTVSELFRHSEREYQYGELYRHQ